MRAYSVDLRERVAAALAEPGSRRPQVAARFGVSLSFVAKLRARQRATGSVAAKPPSRGPTPRLNEAAQQALLALVRQQPDATLAELRQGLLEQQYPAVSTATLCQLLKRLGWRRKKKRRTPASETPSG